MTSKGDIIKTLYSVAENLPTQHLVATERILEAEIARLMAADEGSNRDDLAGIIASLQAQLDTIRGMIGIVINASNDIAGHAGMI